MFVQFRCVVTISCSGIAKWLQCGCVVTKFCFGIARYCKWLPDCYSLRKEYSYEYEMLEEGYSRGRSEFFLLRVQEGLSASCYEYGMLEEGNSRGRSVFFLYEYGYECGMLLKKQFASKE